MLSLLLSTCRRGITWTSLRVCLGWLKCIGTDSSMLSSMFSEAFSLCAAGLANALTRRVGPF